MENENKEQQTTKDFFRENLYFFILAGIVILFSILIIVASVASSNNKKVTNNNVINEEPVNAIITYYMPVINASVLKEYSATELQYNSTLKQWEAHKAVDFLASSGSEVKAITSGKVIDVYTNYLEGTVVKIQHDNGLISEYGSLSDNVKVSKGDTVASNATIGFVSASANAESNDGAHLHFTMYDNNGNKVDPAGFLNISNK